MTIGKNIRGYNLFGLETDLRNIDCSWTHHPEYYISQLHDVGFNHIRLPFSIQYVEEGDFTVMDSVFEIVSRYQPCNITIDAHRVYTSHQGSDPTEGGMTLTRYTDAISILLSRYQHYPFLYGLDVFNEYQGNDVLFWNSQLQQITQKIEMRFPGRFFYFCGGTRCTSIWTYSEIFL
jgi:aryl-phospho-beta-D-glucosidase BglC (GH1 family)